MLDAIKNALGYLKFSDEEEYEDFTDEEEDDDDETGKETNFFKAKQKEVSRLEDRKVASIQKVPAPKEEQPEPKRYNRMERTNSNKIVPIRTTAKGLEVCIMKPTSFEDSQDICDMLLGGRATVVNLEGFDPDDAQRVMDFISGCVYSMNGKLHQISRYIFIFSPDNIDISGDYQELVADAGIGFGVPTLNKEF